MYLFNILRIIWHCSYTLLKKKNVRSRSLDMAKLCFAFSRTKMKSMLIKTQNKNKAKIYPTIYLDRTSLRSIEDLLYYINYKEIKMENPERARKAYLACSGSQAEHRNNYILPTHRLRPMINYNVSL